MPGRLCTYESRAGWLILCLHAYMHVQKTHTLTEDSDEAIKDDFWDREGETHITVAKYE